MTARVLRRLEANRKAIDDAAQKREEAISGLVRWISLTHAASGESLVKLIRSAGLSRQTFYLRQANSEYTGSPGDFDDIRNSFEEAGKTLERLRNERPALIADAAEISAEEIAQAAGVTATWVRVVRRQLAADADAHNETPGDTEAAADTSHA